MVVQQAVKRLGELKQILLDSTKEAKHLRRSLAAPKDLMGLVPAAIEALRPLSIAIDEVGGLLNSCPAFSSGGGAATSSKNIEELRTWIRGVLLVKERAGSGHG